MLLVVVFQPQVPWIASRGGRTVGGGKSNCCCCCFGSFQLECLTLNRWSSLLAGNTVWILIAASTSWSVPPCRFASERLMPQWLSRNVYVVVVARQKNELSTSSGPYNCSTIGSVNCIPIDHMLGQQQHYDWLTLVPCDTRAVGGSNQRYKQELVHLPTSTCFQQNCSRQRGLNINGSRWLQIRKD